MLETICPNCKQRYQLGQDHTCPKKPEERKNKATAVVAPAAGEIERGDSAPSVLQSSGHPKRGRPKTITDMRAYKALKAVEYRARKKQSDKP